ncbi:MAG: ABC transporter ATP-binding protein [Pseudoclavibacter sp.]
MSGIDTGRAGTSEMSASNKSAHGLSSSAVVQVEEVGKSYAGRSVLKGVTFQVNRGEIFGLLGPNGAGKSTLLESIVGLRRISGGSIAVLGKDPRSCREYVTSVVSVQPQSASLFETLSVLETLRLYASFYKHPRPIMEIISEVGLGEQAMTESRNLSGGQLRRLLLGAALVGNPEIVVLDEPSAGLDPRAKQGLLAEIRSLRGAGVTVVLSTHDMQEATQVCDRVAILVEGVVRALDSPEELVRLSGRISTITFVVPGEADISKLRESVPVTSFETELVSDGVKVRIETEDPDTVMRAVTFRGGIRARDFSVQRGTLESYFLDIVARNSGATELGEV